MYRIKIFIHDPHNTQDCTAQSEPKHRMCIFAKLIRKKRKGIECTLYEKRRVEKLTQDEDITDNTALGLSVVESSPLESVGERNTAEGKV